MPKVKVIQSNMSSGELAPTAYGRVDIARYVNAAKRLVNVIPQTLGGAKKRPGLQWVASTKDSTKRSKLVPYIIGKDEAYMLEFGDEYMRVFLPTGQAVMSGGSPYEIVTPYDIDALEDIDYSQSEGAMYIFHRAIYPQRLRTFGDAKWDCSPAPFTTVPFAELGDTPSAALTLSANTIGTGRTMTASSAVFLASDVGRAILWGAGIFVITAFTDTTHVTGEVKVVFESATIPTGAWNLDSSPQSTLTPSAKDPVGASITLTLSADGWRPTDVGKFVRANSGLIRITAYTNATSATGTVVIALSAVTAVPALAWTLESSVWGPDDGYPCTGTLHEQRLVVAGTIRNPQTVFGSKTGEPLDHTIGVADDDAYQFPIDSIQTNQIAYVIGVRNLLVLTYGGEFAMFSGNEKPITPTNVQVKPQSPHGARRVKPVAVGKEVLFVQRAGRKLRAIGYRYDEDGYKSSDLTTLAEHITASGIACMAFQQEPDPVLWVALNSGALVSLTFDRDLDVIAWARHSTEGAVESIATIPYGDSEQVWMITRRSVNGSTVRYVERLQPEWYPLYGVEAAGVDSIPPDEDPFKWGFQLDCAITADDAAGKTTWDGLDHLEGETVMCLADGVEMGEFEVSGGEIVLPRAAKRVLIGLFFSPLVELLPPEIQSASGSVQGDAMSVNEVFMRVVNTAGATVNGSEAIPGRINGPGQLDYPPTLFSGDEKITGLGWSNGQPSTVIEQAHPFPFHLLAVIRNLTINGG